MRQVLVFGGTTEGRDLVAWLASRGTCEIVAATATAYGAGLLPSGPRVTPVVGPLSEGEKHRLMRAYDFVCIVDATHPYAQHISASIDTLAAAWHKDVMRVRREAAAGTERDALPQVPEATGVTFTASADEAARHVARARGNVLLTTGSKDLHAFVRHIPDFQERLYIRVLPLASALQYATELGIPASHIMAMQGPFSQALNCALIRDWHIRCMVTKESGRAGGFDEKLGAAQACGIELVVVSRPPQTDGVSLDEAKARLEERYGL